MANKNIWLNLFEDIYNNGKESSPRGQKIKEIINYQFYLHPINDRFCSFQERGLSLQYAVGEWAWYLSGDRDDLRIENYSDFWKTLRNENSPFFNSNYGYYIFEEKQIDYVFNCLIDDKDTRQACIIINRPNVMMSNSKDKLCTNNITFNIRENKLNMLVSMRSSDAIWGLSFDVIMFSFLYEYLYIKLLEFYPDLEIGVYSQRADSVHIYEKHFDMVSKIIQNKGINYKVIDCPKISHYSEAEFMRNYFSDIEKDIRINKKVSIHIPDSFTFVKFLVEQLCKKWKVEYTK